MIIKTLFIISCIITILLILYLLWHIIFWFLYKIGFNFYDWEDEYPSLLPYSKFVLGNIIITYFLYLLSN